MNEARQREQQKKAKKRTRQGTTHETDLKTSQKGKTNKKPKDPKSCFKRPSALMQKSGYQSSHKIYHTD